MCEIAVSPLLVVVQLTACLPGLWITALQPLLAWAEAVVPQRQWPATPLFLFGTAGLRVLAPERQAKLLGAVQHALHLSHFR